MDEQISQPQAAPQAAAPLNLAVVSPRNKRIGLILILLPMIMLPVILAGYAIASFVITRIAVTDIPAAITYEQPDTTLNRNADGSLDLGLVPIHESSLTAENQDNRMATGSLVKMILGVLALMAFIGVFVCIPLGIYFLTKREVIPGVLYDQRSGKGDFSEVPEEIKGWSWGGAGLTWIWGVYHGVWLSLLCFLPLIGLIMWIVLGINGNEWAWRAQSWTSIEDFKESQRKWGIWGLVFFILGLLPYALAMFTVFSL